MGPEIQVSCRFLVQGAQSISLFKVEFATLFVAPRGLSVLHLRCGWIWEAERGAITKLVVAVPVLSKK